MTYYTVTFKKTFETGNLRGITVDGKVSFPTLSSALGWKQVAQSNTRHKDSQGSMAVWSDFHISAQFEVL